MRVIVLVLFLLLIFSFLYGAVITIGPNKEILVDGKPFFPIMQWLQSRSRMADEKQYGINVFVGQGDSSTALQYCDEAKLQGVWAVPSWDASQVDSVKNHPALLGWVFGDEPDLQSNQVPPSAIQTQYNEIKSKDPNHITFLTLTAGFYSEFSLPAWMGGSDAYYYEYPKYTDVIGFDLYPIYGWCRVDWVYRVGNACDELKNKYGKVNIKLTKKQNTYELKCFLQGNCIKKIGREIKSTTYHNLEIKKEREFYKCSIIFDL